ncbi:MAG TPA: tyrosine-type recombinase/integrase [Longimicrobiales bacterium]|nr:tyrosine-type recombinase/integrase [Longimicrobiales bacterium]
MARKKHWSKVVEESGVTLRLYERENSSAVWYAYSEGGRKLRKSLKTSDRALAEERARDIARRTARDVLVGDRPPTERLTVGQLADFYLAHRGPLLSLSRRRFMEATLALFRIHLGASFVMADFGQHDADTYVAARQSGRVRTADRRGSNAPEPATVKNELDALSTVCNWACGFRRDGHVLLASNPVRGLTKPRQDNPSRPRATEARYLALLAVADEADPNGRLRALLVLAWETGRRINSILHLRASDVLLSTNQIRGALAGIGEDEDAADDWPQALRWRPEWDKMGYSDVSPISGAARNALEVYLRRHPVVGEGFLFPGNRDPSQALHKLMAGYYLTRAEDLAGLPHQKRGGWHAFRRGWATRRKHLPVQDVMAQGGWRDVKALQTAYQGADAKTRLMVAESA